MVHPGTGRGTVQGLASIVVCNTVVAEPPETTRQWIESAGQHRYVQWRCDPWEYYERAAEEFAPLAPWIVFVDPDITIDETSDLAPWMDLPHDLGACEADMGAGAWCSSLAWHTGLCFIRSSVFQRLPRPWFPPFTASECGCMRFRNAATMAGFSSGHAGWVKHARAGTWR